jgi:hypothetical protein
MEYACTLLAGPWDDGNVALFYSVVLSYLCSRGLLSVAAALCRCCRYADIPHEDITCILYDTFDFIENARRGSLNASTAAAAAAGSGGNSTSSAQRQSSLLVAEGNQLQLQQLLGSSSGSLPALPQQQQQQHRDTSAAAAAAASSVAEPCAAAGNCSNSSSGGGHVLVHCSQGVSRSTTIAIAYLMWKTGGSYDEVYQAVRALRGVTSPNVGFMCQLINWAVSVSGV